MLCLPHKQQLALQAHTCTVVHAQVQSTNAAPQASNHSTCCATCAAHHQYTIPCPTPTWHHNTITAPLHESMPSMLQQIACCPPCCCSSHPTKPNETPTTHQARTALPQAKAKQQACCLQHPDANTNLCNKTEDRGQTSTKVCRNSLKQQAQQAMPELLAAASGPNKRHASSCGKYRGLNRSASNTPDGQHSTNAAHPSHTMPTAAPNVT
ncbi:hypothetical protein COO60DRAFT_156362 [Scenedesmus sp. NREL 46B-D3]|nr:hypothetical protein COO60DRAFT_156362 [Scenedesmus sp. NREL 46B-D3]